MIKELTPNALYNHFGKVMVAVDEEYLVPIMEVGDTKHGVNDTTELMALPGTLDWVDRMTSIRQQIARDLKNERAALISLRTYVDNLGEALRDEAIKREWCEEYDEFAEEWNLPKRTHDYEVTVTVRIKAASEEEATDYVREQVSLDTHDHDNIDDVDFYTTMV